MFDDDRALNMLKTELIFMKLRGYSPRHAEPELFFEDSPGCIKRNCPSCTCSDCALIQLVPAEHRLEEAACRHIPLDEIGTTLDLLYRFGNSQETADAVEDWLRIAIDQLREKSLPALSVNAVEAATCLNQSARI
jgi:hypothetical protein